VGSREALMLERFDREWDADAGTYRRFGLVSGLTVIDAEDGYVGRERWSYLLLADELRRWSVRSVEDRRELFLRMVFNAMVTNNDDHPRNHALVNTRRARLARVLCPPRCRAAQHRDAGPGDAAAVVLPAHPARSGVIAAGAASGLAG
jgi:hypothetical protein